MNAPIVCDQRLCLVRSFGMHMRTVSVSYDEVGDDCAEVSGAAADVEKCHAWAHVEVRQDHCVHVRRRLVEYACRVHVRVSTRDAQNGKPGRAPSTFRFMIEQGGMRRGACCVCSGIGRRWDMARPASQGAVAERW